MRRTASSIEIGSASAIASGSASSSRRDGVTVSLKPRPTRTSSSRRRSRCSRLQPARHRAPERQREGHVGKDEAGDFLDEVDLARQVASAPRRDAVGAAPRARPETSRGSPPAPRGRPPSRSPRPPSPDGRDAAAGRAARVDLGVSGPACARELDNELGRHGRGLLGQVRVDPLLPAIGALRAQPHPLGAAHRSRPARSSQLRAGRSWSSRIPRSPRRP